MAQGLFSPKINGGAVIASGTTAARATFAAVGTVGAAGNALSVVNGGTATAFIDIETTGSGTAVATTSHAILANAPPLILPIPAGTIYLQHVTSSGTATLYATRGNIS